MPYNAPISDAALLRPSACACYATLFALITLIIAAKSSSPYPADFARLKKLDTKSGTSEFIFESRGKVKAKNKGEIEMYFVENGS